MKISNNFTLEEMTVSSTAKRLGIDNTPDEKSKENIIRLVKQVLQPIRDKWGAPIVVSSGYRCPKLNKAVNGASTSQHTNGSAVDFHTVSDTLEDNKKLYDLVIGLAKRGIINCRQIIWEYGKKNVGPDWIHISINCAGYSLKNNQILQLGAK